MSSQTMNLTFKEAQQIKVFYIESRNVDSMSLADFVHQSVDETTTPRGIAPRVFIESETIQIDKNDFNSEEEFLDEINSTNVYFADEFRNANIEDFEKIGSDIFELTYYVISSWGIRGNNYSSGKTHYSNVFLSEDKANDELFKRIYESDFAQDDQRDTRYFNSEDEAIDAIIENLSFEWSCDEEVVRHILRKQAVVDELRQQKVFESRKKESERVDSLASIYSNMICRVDGENYKETAKRLSDTIGQKIESKVFHATVKIVRNTHLN